MRERVAVYVERDGRLLVFDHRDAPEAGTQVPAGGVEPGETSEEAAVREVLEETGVALLDLPELIGTHDHVDGLGNVARTSFFRVAAPAAVPESWQHVVAGNGEDAGLVFDCRFDATPQLWPDQAVFRR